MQPTRMFTVLVALTALGAVIGLAQYRTAREAAMERYEEADIPAWTNEPAFSKDVFTFARVQYSVDGRHGLGKSGQFRWMIDFPDSDMNFAWRLQQITSIKVNPEGRVIKITDKELFDYPFLYIVEPGRMTFTDEEVPILRSYLLNGGFVMFDDFWGDREWGNFEQEIKRVFPDRQVEDIPIEHEIFKCVFPLTTKPQVPGLPHALRGRTHERGAEGEEVHYRGIFDDRRRLMAIICHNTDLGDGWEREGNVDYFRQYSEKMAYPMGINIVFYAMTH